MARQTARSRRNWRPGKRWPSTTPASSITRRGQPSPRDGFLAAQTLAYQARRSGTGEDLLGGLADIDRAVTRFAATLGQLLDVPRPQAGQLLALRRRATELVAVVEQHGGSIVASTIGHGMTVTVRLPSDPPNMGMIADAT